MKKLREILTTDFLTVVLRLRHGPMILAAGWITLHGVFVYELVSGKIKIGRGGQWFEARESSHGLYWVVIALFAAFLLAGDISWFRFTFRAGKKTPNQPAQTTTASSTPDRV
jgi:hypothetical protein